jgi:diacylglycerol kinase family enzyme
VLVGNNQYELDGFQLGGRQRLDEGCLHVSMAPDMTRVELVRLLFAAFTGRLRGEERLDSFSVSSFSIEARRRRLGVSLDGELWIMQTPLRFQIRPHALRVIVPAS